MAHVALGLLVLLSILSASSAQSDYEYGELHLSGSGSGSGENSGDPTLVDHEDGSDQDDFYDTPFDPSLVDICNGLYPDGVSVKY